MNGTNNAAPKPDWATLVRRIQHGEEAAVDEMYREFRPFLNFFRHQTRQQDANDLFHELIWAVVMQIRRGDVKEPERIAGYASMIARYKVASWVSETIQARRHQSVTDVAWMSDNAIDPESAAIENERQEIARRILLALGPRDREVLIRFYLDDQRAEQIRAEMGLTETQFRLIKSRAKLRFTALCRERLAMRPRVHLDVSAEPQPA